MKYTLMLMLSFLLIGTVVSCKKKGCTDQTANNYDAEAKKDNGTCTYDEEEEEEFGLATVTTSPITNLTTMTATSGGSIVTNGTIYDKGLCWSTSPNPTKSDSTVSEGNNADAFVTNMSNLTQNTTYYVRAYAENYYGVAYGNEQTFTTETIVLPTVTTNTVTLVTSSRVNVTATVTSDGGGIISEKGICWATTTNPTPADMHLTYGGDVTDFDLDLWNLESDQTYYIRAYITNEAGTSYGNELEYVNPHVFVMGEYFEGGVVAYITNDGLHGVVVATEDQSTSAEYGCDNVVTGATDDLFMTGSANTDAILANCATPGIAADLCANLTLNGYSDWFLPSINTVSNMYFNITEINNGCIANGGTALTNTQYWSSTEYGVNSVWSANPTSGNSGGGVKTNLHYVRAVRLF